MNNIKEEEYISEIEEEVKALFLAFDDKLQKNIKEDIERKGLVETGSLKNSIDVKHENKGMESDGIIYMNDYGEFLELGTSKIAPYNFVRDSINKTIKDIKY